MDTLFSKSVKSGKTTYFLDVKEARNQSKYLTISSSAPSKDDPQKFSKRSVIVFNNAANDFLSALKEASQVIQSESDFTKMVKAGRITYFINVKEAKNQSKYLSIASSQPSKEDPKKFSRRSITVFDNVANDFIGALEEVKEHLQ